MFDALSGRLGAALGDLRKRGTLDEESISRAMREIRLALLEADVNLDVVGSFTARVRERALGEDVLKSLTPGQQVVRIVRDEMLALFGETQGGLTTTSQRPRVVLLLGLQGERPLSRDGKSFEPLRAPLGFSRSPAGPSRLKFFCQT